MDILYDSKNLKFDFYEIYYQAAYLEDDLYIEAIADGHHFPDTLLRLMVKNKGYDKMILVTDSMSAAGFGDGLFYLGNPEDHHQVLIKMELALCQICLALQALLLVQINW